MKAGRELDALVAEKVMGHTVRDGGIGITRIWDSQTGWLSIPQYSTDIAAAWEVIEKLRHGGWVMELENMCGADCIGVTFSHDPAIDEEDMSHSGREETAPLAICLAALKAVGHEAL